MLSLLRPMIDDDDDDNADGDGHDDDDDVDDDDEDDRPPFAVCFHSKCGQPLIKF